MEEERWCFAKDDDGHDFLIPAKLKEKFDKDMEEAYVTGNFGLVDWTSEYRCCHPSWYTFTDPKGENDD
jgi:hypothetical protein